MEHITQRPKFFRTDTSLKTVHVEALKWHDKTYGNTYFSAQITINNRWVVCLPFQYGYGSQFEFEAVHELQRLGMLSDKHQGAIKQAMDDITGSRNNCTISCNDALKRDVIAHGEGRYL